MREKKAVEAAKKLNRKMKMQNGLPIPDLDQSVLNSWMFQGAIHCCLALSKALVTQSEHFDVSCSNAVEIVAEEQ